MRFSAAACDGCATVASFFAGSAASAIAAAAVAASTGGPPPRPSTGGGTTAASSTGRVGVTAIIGAPLPALPLPAPGARSPFDALTIANTTIAVINRPPTASAILNPPRLGAGPSVQVAAPRTAPMLASAPPPTAAVRRGYSPPVPIGGVCPGDDACRAGPTALRPLWRTGASLREPLGEHAHQLLAAVLRRVVAREQLVDRLLGASRSARGRSRSSSFIVTCSRSFGMSPRSRARPRNLAEQHRRERRRACPRRRTAAGRRASPTASRRPRTDRCARRAAGRSPARGSCTRACP